MHLITDEAFYYNYFKEKYEYIEREHKNFYKDYDSLNKMIINEYKITYIPETVKKYFKEVKGEAEILKLQKVKDFINRLSNIPIEEQIEQIKKKIK